MRPHIHIVLGLQVMASEKATVQLYEETVLQGIIGVRGRAGSFLHEKASKTCIALRACFPEALAFREKKETLPFFLFLFLFSRPFLGKFV
jgi:hypothetical protein